MTRIKSAFELAIEKMKGQEVEREKDAPSDEAEEYIKAAALLGRTFLKKSMNKEEIKEKLQRYPEKVRPAALRAFLAELTAGLNLENTGPILETVAHLRQDEEAGQACARAKELHHRYQNLLAEKLAQLEAEATQWQLKKYARAGIKGDAIAGFNLEGTAAWQEVRQQYEAEYAARLKDLLPALLG